MEGKVEERRVQRLGTSSLIMTLPKKWVKNVGLKQGDLVRIIIKDNYLVVLPLKTAKGFGEIFLKITPDLSEYVVSDIPKCLYKLGVEKASIISKGIEPRIINKIISSVHSLPGAKPMIKEENIIIEFKFMEDTGRLLPLLSSQIENLILTLKSIANLVEKGVNEEAVIDAKSLLLEVERTHFEITRIVSSQGNLGIGNKPFKHLEVASLCVLELTMLSVKTISTLHKYSLRLPGKEAKIVIDKLIYILKDIINYIRGDKDIKEIKEEFRKIREELTSKAFLQSNPYMFAKTEDFIIILENLISALSCWETSKTLANLIISSSTVEH